MKVASPVKFILVIAPNLEYNKQFILKSPHEVMKKILQIRNKIVLNFIE